MSDANKESNKKPISEDLGKREVIKALKSENFDLGTRKVLLSKNREDKKPKSEE